MDSAMRYHKSAKVYSAINEEYFRNRFLKNGHKIPFLNDYKTLRYQIQKIDKLSLN